jgi:hypothetical protein
MTKDSWIKNCSKCPFYLSFIFVDDSVVFCRATRAETHELTNIINLYEGASGQKVNLDKFEMCFSKNSHRSIKQSFKDVFPIQITDKMTKYLGIPAYVGRSKNNIFQNIVDKIRSKLKGWKERCLSFVGRAILIKAVAQATPTYIMSFFYFLWEFVSRLRVLCASSGGEIMIWIRRFTGSISKSCAKSKKNGGMGFRTMRAFNEAMLAKHC